MSLVCIIHAPHRRICVHSLDGDGGASTEEDNTPVLARLDASLLELKQRARRGAHTLFLLVLFIHSDYTFIHYTLYPGLYSGFTLYYYIIILFIIPFHSIPHPLIIM